MDHNEVLDSFPGSFQESTPAALVDRLLSEDDPKIMVKLKDLKKGDRVFVEGREFGTVTGPVMQCGRQYCRVDTTNGPINQHRDTTFSVIRPVHEDCEDIPSLKGKGITVTHLPDGPNGSRRFRVTQQSAGGMEDDHWIANQISWHHGAKNQFTVGDRKGNSFVVVIPKAQ